MASTITTEQLFISSVLINRDIEIAFKYNVTPDFFRAHAAEWQWILNFVKRNKKLPSKPVFVTNFSNFPLQRVNDTEHLARELQRRKIEREMKTFISEAAGLLQDSGLDSALDFIRTEALKVGAQYGGQDEGDIFSNPDDILEKFQATYDRAATDGVAGIPLGFPTYDRFTGGFKPGELVSCCARLGVGKSWFLLKGASSAIKMDLTAVYHSLEMPRDQMAARMMPMLAKQGGALFNNISLMQGKDYSMADFRLFMKRLQEAIKGRLHIIGQDRNGLLTPNGVAASIERHHPDIVFIDYVGLMSRTKSWDEVGRITGELKQVALAYGIPIVQAVQLNREAAGMSKKGEPPGTETISNSDMIGMDSDTIVTAAAPSARTLAALLAKNRHGKSGKLWNMEFNPGEGVFKEIRYSRKLQLISEDKINAANESMNENVDEEEDYEDNDDM